MEREIHRMRIRLDGLKREQVGFVCVCLGQQRVMARRERRRGGGGRGGGGGAATRN